jgi:hypothetical protein
MKAALADNYSNARSFTRTFTTSNATNSTTIAAGSYSLSTNFTCYVLVTTESASYCTGLASDTQPAASTTTGVFVVEAGSQTMLTIPYNGTWYISAKGRASSGTLEIVRPITESPQ